MVTHSLWMASCFLPPPPAKTVRSSLSPLLSALPRLTISLSVPSRPYMLPSKSVITVSTALRRASTCSRSPVWNRTSTQCQTTQKRMLATMVSSSTGQGRLAPQGDLLPPTIQPSTSTTMPAPNAMPSFFKRPLPSTCVGFDSAEGKQLFKKAMHEGYMEKYFSLAQSFLTQNEVGHCVGLGRVAHIDHPS